jgi:hypothetical protein
MIKKSANAIKTVKYLAYRLIEKTYTKHPVNIQTAFRLITNFRNAAHKFSGFDASPDK